MKKIVAVLLFFILIEDIIVAQSDLRLGFQVSPAFTWMNTTDNQVQSNGTNLGLKLGMASEFFFRENYAFIIGLGFAFNHGGTLLHENGGRIWQRSNLQGASDLLAPGTDLKYKLQYVEIPFGLKFRTKEFGYLRYYAEVPVITLGFKSQAKGNITNINVNEDIPDIKKEVLPLSLSWGLGAGVEYGISENTALIGGIGYQRVFTDVTKNYGEEAETKGFFNSLIIRLGVMF